MRYIAYNQSTMNFSNTFKDQHIRSMALEVLFKSFESLKPHYTLLNKKSYLDRVKLTDYVIPNYVGIPIYIVFLSTQHTRMCIIIDKNSITKIGCATDNINIAYINTSMQRIYVNVGDIIYSNSVLEGIMIKSDIYVNNAYMFANKSLRKDNLNSRIINVSTYFDKSSIKGDTRETKFVNFVEVVPVLKIRDLVAKYISSKEDRGIVNGFSIMKTLENESLIYLFSNDPEEFNPDSIPQKSAHLMMKKTKICDTYILYASKNVIRKGEKVTKNVRIGYAHIPNAKTSTFCAELCEYQKSVIVLCVQYKGNDNWIPISKSDEEVPNDISVTK